MLTAYCFYYCALGTDRLCRDCEFMIGRNPGIYWRTCWTILTPLVMAVILLYTLISYKALTYKNEYYPSPAYGKHTHEPLVLDLEITNLFL